MGPTIKIKKPVDPAETNANEPKLKKIKLKTGSSSNAKLPAKTTPKIKIKLKKRDDGQKGEESNRPVGAKLSKARSSAKSEKNGNKSGGKPMKLKLNLKKKDELRKSNTVKTPRFRIKPVRVPGEGYDSEASDVEDDPLIEEGIILRVLPDLSAEFVKNSIESGDYSGLSIKWKGERHAVVKVNGIQYGAVLVNLPSVIEVNKSVDRKNLLKTFDVSQMLVCVSSINKEEDVFSLQVSDTEDLTKKHFEEYEKEILEQRKQQLKGYNGGPLTDAETKNIESIITKGYDYKHGITPPLYNARNRRFRHKMGPTEIDYVERTVERLLQMDAEAEEFGYELVNEDSLPQQRSASAADLSVYHPTSSHLEPLDASKNGASTDAAAIVEAEDHEEDLEFELEQALQDESPMPTATTPFEQQNPVAQALQQKGPLLEETGDDVEQDNGEDDDDEDEEEEDEEDEEEEDEEEEEEDEDEDEDEDDDEETAIPGFASRSTSPTTATAVSSKGRTVDGNVAADEVSQHNELLRDELRELETTLEVNRAKANKATNPLLKTRFLESIKKLEKEVDLKRKQLLMAKQPLERYNEDDEDDDEDDEDEGEGEGEGEIELDDEDDQNEASQRQPTEELDQDDMDMMLLFGAEDND